MRNYAQNIVKVVNQDETNNLRDRVAAIVRAISDGDDRYWNAQGYFGILDQPAIVADIMAAVVECDGEEALEAFGGG